MSAIDTPAEPPQETNSTDQQAKGGLFTDTTGVGIDLSSLVGPAGRGIANIVQTPANPGEGVDSTVTVTYTDGSTPSVFDTPSGPDGLDGASITGATINDDSTILTLTLSSGGPIEVMGTFRGAAGMDLSLIHI